MTPDQEPDIYAIASQAALDLDSERTPLASLANVESKLDLTRAAALSSAYQATMAELGTGMDMDNNFIENIKSVVKEVLYEMLCKQIFANYFFLQAHARSLFFQNSVLVRSTKKRRQEIERFQKSVATGTLSLLVQL